MSLKKIDHFPVMLDQILSIITPQHGGTFIDCTFGGGGYSKAILKYPNTKVLALDRDKLAQKHAKELALFVTKELNKIKDVAFMADDREDFALMLYYIRDFKGKRAKWNGDIKIDDHFELTTDTNNLVGNNILFLTRTAPTEEMIKRSTSYKLVKELNFFNRKKIKKYNLYLLMNWKKSNNLTK